MDFAIPFFGYKSHISVDRKFRLIRLIRKWKVTDAAAGDGARLREVLLDGSNTASDVWANTAYRSKANEVFMEKHGFISKVHRKKPHLKPMPRHIQRSNAEKSSVRFHVEPVFADQKAQTGLFIRTGVSPVPPRGSGWPISSTTCVALYSWNLSAPPLRKPEYNASRCAPEAE